ncbi:putative 2og-fe oxygenase [Phaeomoniella chlamydospora]|uniref:Putative 2og-fe oxygenase n=1 Tax=Phaeomoniella chlamydospora TaxID=158046 RepID=A0A0G2EZB7_PHACM|nr:putative 2og-fe oxygenase [Phaeomoniella chlamydospora]
MPLADVPNGSAPVADASINLPIFDVSIETPEIGKALIAAAAKWGFLWIAGSPDPKTTSATANGASDARHYEFDDKTVDDVFALSKKFFLEASPEEKQACSIKHNRGYVGMHVENLDPSKHSRGDFKQAFNLAEPQEGKWWQPMPSVFSAEEEFLIDFHKRCRSMSERILRLMAMGLEISDTDWLVSRHKAGSQSTRFLYYPSLPKDSDYNAAADIRAGAHSDYGTITLLFQRPGQPGLELLTPDGSWASVPIFPPNYHSSTFPPIVVNIGDLLSYWTNGLLRSTIHRVILTNETEGSKLGEDRFSLAVFIGPRDETELVPMPSRLVAERAAEFAAGEGKTIGHGGGVSKVEKMTTMTAGEHLSNRLQATYGAVYQPEVKSSA